jgi:hypothetical protein
MCVTLGIALVLAARSLAAEPTPDAIFGGRPTDSCEWPTVVRVGDCSGLLVHPEIVVTAGHCQDVDEVAFGVDDADAQRVPTVECRDTGEHEPGEGLDLGWCRLAEPRDDLAIVSPLVGDEAAALRAGDGVRIVGFGLTEDGVFGVQHEVETTLVEIDGDLAFLGGDGLDSCLGDSGAPAFAELHDGTLRAFAITSFGPFPCGQGGWYTRLAAGMPWLEDSTGIDLTPCHDAGGRWAPDERCGAEQSPPVCADASSSSGCSLADPTAAPALGLVVAIAARRRRRA